MKIRACFIVFFSLFFYFNLAQSAKLCAKFSANSGWDTGVFSVVDSSGVTVATTTLMPKGAEACTTNVKDGIYVIRFNGALGASLPSFSDVYGCISTPYSFSGNETVTVVFNNGQPPFNNNEFCRPSRS